MNLKDKIRWQMAEIGVKVRGISVMIDLVNACSFKCPSCPVGNMPQRDGGKMSFKFYSRMMNKIQEQVKVRYVLLYSFSEPFLCSFLAKVVLDLKRRGIKRVMISTNLSRPDQLEAVMAAGLDELRISFSGFEQGEYFHMGRDMKQFIRACDDLKVMNRYDCRAGLIFHRYKTNLHEIPKVKQFAKEHNLTWLPETAFFIPFEKILGVVPYSGEDVKLIKHLILSPEEKLKRIERDNICYYQQKQIVIDANGKVFLCRHVYDDALIVGDIMVDSIQEIRKRMAGNPFCLKCKSAGLNRYTEPTLKDLKG